ncbi:hypothetical protein LJ737_05840 [Hymenobacter sp. 15J16-1T3B]|uniref:hypothetical protein n=1 Tax=Hymenobacter sp. 15J16-1T3B TaxID=2886941 RepID=UPI001D125F51|nr:hypothetical protein [Hymenobacter sp. 15J16-1T3B]MCC3156750.1 hypothetical protein [Hymenobacter sp. 15J16-1T3B]
MMHTSTSSAAESIRFIMQATCASATAPAHTAGTTATIQPASLAAREEFLSFLALNAHFSADDLNALRELLSRYSAAAVYNAVQRACRAYFEEHRSNGYAMREVQLSKLLLSPLFHFACRTHLPAAA